MKPNDPPPQTSGDPSGQPPGGGSGGQEPGDDPLDTLRDRIRSTQDAVERLADEAANAAREAAAAGPEQPSGEGEPRGGGQRYNGYAVPGAGAADQSTRELQALVGLIEVVRGLIPRELADQLAELVRELLLLARALIDWYLDRLELRRKTPVEVEDIPIS
jgi:hypothetical protein